MKKLAPETDVETLSVRVMGKVQGVGFRMATVRQAHSLGVAGWVRNLDDGSVEALLQGPHDRIDEMLSWLRVGPPAARVDEIESQEIHDERHYDRFEQI
ncbi:acylphosphatase [Achromobacter sp. F4_2707]|uniref:acylphosphatase n=1 Tax=Achromobacter sp. F4_2707 TaxID=3114286 RepID=UPI0039C744F7